MRLFPKYTLIISMMIVIFLMIGKVVYSQENITSENTPKSGEEFKFQSVEVKKQFSNEFYKAKVVKITKEGKDNSFGGDQFFQLVEVEILSGKEKGSKVEIKHISSFGDLKEHQKVSPNETVVVVKTAVGEDFRYFISEKYRLDYVIILFVVFFTLAIIFGRWKGLGSIVGLGFSIFIIIEFVVPNISAGKDPIIISLIASLIIATISLYIAHGFSKRTSVALASTIITLFLAAFLANVFVNAAKLFGMGTEEAFYLQQSQLKDINLKGLLLGSIIIGVLGILDDITTAQSAAVDEIRKANPKFKFYDLYLRGLSIGREHIASLVNTLALVYISASLPIFLLFASNNTQPLWVLANNEFIVEEIVRILVGSTSLILAVPISTLIAAKFLSKTTS